MGGSWVQLDVEKLVNYYSHVAVDTGVLVLPKLAERSPHTIELVQEDPTKPGVALLVVWDTDGLPETILKVGHVEVFVEVQHLVHEHLDVRGGHFICHTQQLVPASPVDYGVELLGDPNLAVRIAVPSEKALRFVPATTEASAEAPGGQAVTGSTSDRQALMALVLEEGLSRVRLEAAA